MRSSLVCEAIENAQKNRGCLPELFHSDRGSQYVSDEVEAKLKTLNISMSRKGNCWDTEYMIMKTGNYKLTRAGIDYVSLY